MKVSYQWLNNFVDKKLPAPEAVADALTFHAFEIDGVEAVGADHLLDVKVTANRGHDCLSHRGIARELSAICNLPFNKEFDPFTFEIDLSHKASGVEVSIDSVLCKRYIAAHITGIKVGPSPAWVTQALEAIGQRPINNIVDITNLVMFNLGQPLHAFDASKLEHKGPSFMGSGMKDGPLCSIRIRNARAGEKIITLDTKAYELTPDNLLIVDDNSDTPIGIAGVKGGLPASINDDTTDIIIESANFDGVSVRKTAAALKLRTDASQRFEQVLSPVLAEKAMAQAVRLILQLAGGELQGFVDEYPNPIEQKLVSVTLEKINAVLGTNYSEKEVEDVFERLGFRYQKDENDRHSMSLISTTYTVTPPFERLDLVIPEDLVEEVGRIIGYDKVESQQLPALDRQPLVNKNFYWSERVREFLVQNGFSEIYTSVFAEEGERVVLNKVDGVKPYLRESLVSGMEEALEKNKRNAEMLGLPDVRLFEIGTVFSKPGHSNILKNVGMSGGGAEKLMLIVGVQGNKKSPKPEDIVKEMLDTFAPKGHLWLPKMPFGGPVAELNLSELISVLPEPVEYEKLPTSNTERYQPFSKYPFIIRDVAVWVPQGSDMTTNELADWIWKIAGSLCLQVMFFDSFEKEGKKSFAFRLIFQSTDRTLTEEEVNPNMEAVYKALKDKGFTIR